MNIVMMTNTCRPHVGGVAQSVERFTKAYRDRGHNVLVVAPEFEGDTPREGEVRLPAVQNFNGSDFSVVLPVPMYLTNALNDFQPGIVHSHHPFMLGDTALRVSATRDIPLVFTHHTMYEHYTHYVPGDAERLRVFVKELCTGYANCCDHVIAPSESVREVLRRRGVATDITVLPTGVDTGRFASGDRDAARSRLGIPGDAWVVGHVSRLAPEKNLDFLAGAVCRFLEKRANAWFLVVGDGPRREAMERTAWDHGLADRVLFTGKLQGGELVGAYRAMDVFAFSSKSETQGMVLVEAMAAGAPVVALDGPGVRDVVDSGRNGVVVEEEDEGAFAGALEEIAAYPAGKRNAMREGAGETARDFSIGNCAGKALSVYERLLDQRPRAKESADLSRLLDTVATEWRLWKNRLSAASAVVENLAEGLDLNIPREEEDPE